MSTPIEKEENSDELITQWASAEDVGGLVGQSKTKRWFPRDSHAYCKRREFNIIDQKF
jgi:hypothetical protein